MKNSDDPSVNWKLLTRYVAGECTRPERASVEAWADANTEREHLLEDLQHAWEAVGPPSDAPSPDVNAAWGELRDRMRTAERKVARPARRSARDARSDRQPRRRHASASSRSASRSSRLVRTFPFRMAAAAAFVLAIVVVGIFTLDETGNGDAPEGKVFSTQRGQRAVVELTDGTRVRLNADSRLVLLDGGLSEDRRRVRLDGEAYFEVARDTTRPFLVHTAGDAAVRVLGTAFNVEAYAADTASVQVAVAEGAVLLRAGNARLRDTLRLLPRQLGIASADGVLEAQRDVDLSNRLAWTEGRLAFEDAPFQEVMRRLERWYDLQIKVHSPMSAIDYLNAEFHDAPLRQILSDIALALNLHYERSGTAVTFYRLRGQANAPAGKAQ